MLLCLCSDEADTLVPSCSHASHPRVPYNGLDGPVQGFRALPPFTEFIANMEGTQGAAPDWKSTAFWRRRGFAQAWVAFRRREERLLSEHDLPKALARDKCAPDLNPATARALLYADLDMHAVVVRMPVWDSTAFQGELRL